MHSKHSALGSRILGINRNNHVILPLETNMAVSWLKCPDNERHFVELRRCFTVNFTTNEAKQAAQR